MKKNRILILLLLAALLALTACGGDAKKEATPAPTEAPTAAPTEAPTPEPTAEPTAAPTEAPTPEPTEEPTPEPTEEPTPEPTEAPTPEPTEEPTPEPTEEPTPGPTEAPEAQTIGGADGATAILVADEATPDEATPDEATPGEADDPVIATAYDGALTLRASEVRDDYDASLQSAIDYYAQYGYTMDEYDEELQASVAQETVQLRMSQLVAQRHSDELGYVLTDEHAAELAQQAEDTIASVRDYYEGYLSYYGYEGDELDAIVEEQLQAGGYTYDELYESLLLNDRLGFLYDIATKDVSVSDEDVKTYFDAKLAEAQERYADIDEFINDYLSGAELLVTPEGLRTVNCIYIAPVEGEATPGEAAEATADEAAADEATPDEADPAALSGYAKAAAVRAQLDAGMSFEEAMIAYNEDGATEEQLAAGYPVAEAAALYSDAFKDAALALAAPGDVSDVVCAEEGYFILRYKEDLTPATAALEERLETETAEALTSKQNEAFSAYVDQMLEDAGIVVGDLTALYHVFEPDRVEAEIAYATVSADAQLTDMPAGDAVAALHAGVALDVLGRIGMDGENYAFVAVMGTQIKGYVDASALSDLAEADALATDNAALCEAETALPDKLPTFTIVMNDGSLIYGELYPDVAPETVGNFVSLAGSGFYDGLTFHRVVPGFVIQGGDPNGDGTGGPGYAIRGEFESNGVTNDLSHMRGVLSMARSSSPDSAGSQFFIMHADNDYLDGDYAAFGLVLGGIETVDVIASTPTDGNDRPLTEQTMRAVYVETYGHSYAFTKLDD